jgi:sugar phosphate isomerase/epimerase
MSFATRRSFVSMASLAAAAYATRPAFSLGMGAASSPFHVSVINDEISPDFDHACSVVANDFGLRWIELRNLWGKGLHDLSDDQLVEAEKILAKYKLGVTDIASPLFKVDWPGAPRSKESPTHDTFSADVVFKKQNALLERCMALAKRFKTDKIRCFDFWRIADVAPYRKAINEKLHDSAELCGKQGLELVIENEPACNTATGREAIATLAAVPSKHFFLNWDPGNAVLFGELDAFPTVWKMLPKERIHHCHCKNVVNGANGKREWSPVDVGLFDWVGQFRALKDMGYHHAVSLETHWHSGKGPEDSTRTSWVGMKKDLEAAGAF